MGTAGGHRYCYCVIVIAIVTAIELPLGGSSAYSGTDKTNNNKYT